MGRWVLNHMVKSLPARRAKAVSIWAGFSEDVADKKERASKRGWGVARPEALEPAEA